MPRPPLAWPVRKPIVWAVAGVLVVLGIVGVRAWRADPVKTPDDTAIIDTPLIDNEIVELVVSNPGYLGPQACAECHAERVAEFQGTRHFLANCVPSSGILPAGFLPGRGEFQVPGSSLRFEMTASEGRFLQTATRESIPPNAADRRGNRVHLRSRRWQRRGLLHVARRTTPRTADGLAEPARLVGGRSI